MNLNCVSLFFFAVCSALPMSLHAQAKPNAPGKMVDIGGYSLYMNCTGEGSPTVILENGLGDVSSVWSLVQPQLAKSGRVCSYDRAYDGFSDGGPIPWTFHQEIFELHQLLKASNIKPPYVLVGNSVGGLLNQLYKTIYPDEVVGMVLVDSTHVDTVMGPGPLRKSADATSEPQAQTMGNSPPPPLTKAEQDMLDEALIRLASQAEKPLEPPYDLIPVDVQPVYRWEHSHPHLPPAGNSNVNWWANEMQQMYVDRQARATPYGDMPLIVLAAHESTTDPERFRQVNDMVLMSTNSILIIDAQGGHTPQLTSPGLVVNSVQAVIHAARNESRVSEMGN